MASAGPGQFPLDGLGVGGDSYGNKIEGLKRPSHRTDRLPKEAYNYRQAVSGERCSTCQNSQFPPGSKTGICQVVLGDINADAVCDAFAPVFAVTASSLQKRGRSTDHNDMDLRSEIASLSLQSLSYLVYELELAKDFTEEDRDRMAKSGEAEDDGSYPIPDVNHLKKAIKAFERSKNKSKTKAHIRKRAKALNSEDLLPANWNDQGSGD